MLILDGKACSDKIKKELKEKVKSLQTKPGLTVVIVGEDPASMVYTKNKKIVAEKLGYNSDLISLPHDTQSDTLSSLIHFLNQNPTIHGILLQLPLPKHLDPMKHLLEIDPQKDVDGFHPLNAGRLSIGLETFVPCTPLGCIRLLEENKIEMAGKNAVVIGRSNIVGKPLFNLLLQKNASVSVIHSKTKNPKEITRNADLIFAAVGVAKMIDSTWLGRDCSLVDVGINRLDDGSLCGDMNYEDLILSPFCKAITPVPGGIGPMTIAMLMENTLQACLNQTSL